MLMSEEEKAEEAERARSARKEREAEERRQRIEGSPQGQARLAFERDLDWFEIRMNVRGSDRSNAGRSTQSVTLIEKEGWRLVCVNHVYVPSSFMIIPRNSDNRFSLKGEIVGVYMFRRDASKRLAT